MGNFTHLSALRSLLLTGAAFLAPSAVAQEVPADQQPMILNLDIDLAQPATQNDPLADYSSISPPQSIFDIMAERGYTVTIESLRPAMNWRNDLGSPVGQFDSTNTRPSVGMVNMVRSDTSASLGFCSGTLINARFYLTAAHCVRDGIVPDAIVRASINFNPATGGIFTGPGTRNAVSIVTPGTYVPSNFSLGQDLAIIALDRPVYDIAGSPIATTNTVGQTLNIVGYGTAGTGSVPNQIFDGRRRLGTNLNEGVFITQVGATGTVIVADFEDPLNAAGTDFFGTPVFTTREAATAPGDSGGPIFDSSGRVLGVASGVFTIGVSGWGYGSLPFWTNLTEAQYQTFIANNNPLRLSSSAASGVWGAGATWSGGITPDNTFHASDNPFAVADYTIGQRFYNVTIGSGHTVTLNDFRDIDIFSITSGSTLDVNGGLLDFWGQSSTSGNLIVNGAVRSLDPTGFGVLSINGSGRLSGVGLVQAPVINSGTVAPGNSIGTLTVASFFQGPTGLLDIELSNVSSDVLAVTTNASLAGAVRFQPFGPAPTLGQQYNFITTGGTVSGTFSSVIDLIPGPLFPVVTYGSNFARVTVANFCTVADDEVDTPVCNALSDPAVQADPDMAPAIALLQQIPSVGGDLEAALEALNPTRANAQAVAGLEAGDLLRNQFGRRSHDVLGGTGDIATAAQLDMARAQLASSAPTADMLAYAAANSLQAIDGTGGGGGGVSLPNGYAMFFAADVGLSKTDQPAALGKDESTVAALTAGVDSSDGKGTVFGVALSYLQSNIDQNYGLGGMTSGDGVAISGYGSTRSGRLYMDGYLSYGWHNFDTERTLITGPFTRAIAKGSTDASQFLAGATFGYNLCNEDLLTMGAVGGLYYNGLEIDGYTETGAGPLSAVLADRSVDSLRGQVGGEAALHLSQSLVPLLRVVWNHEFMDDALVSQAGFAGAPATTFTVPGPSLGSDWVTVGAGISGYVSEGTSFTFRYQHDFGRDGQDNQQVSAAARMAF